MCACVKVCAFVKPCSQARLAGQPLAWGERQVQLQLVAQRREQHPVPLMVTARWVLYVLA